MTNNDDKIKIKYEKMVETNKQKTIDTQNKVFEALEDMLKNNEKITYYSVSKKTGVSRNFLYKNKEINLFIEKYKSSKSKKTNQSSEAKDVIITAQRKKISELESKIKQFQLDENYKVKYEKAQKEILELKKQLESSYDY